MVCCAIALVLLHGIDFIEEMSSVIVMFITVVVVFIVIIILVLPKGDAKAMIQLSFSTYIFDTVCAPLGDCFLCVEIKP